MNLDEIIALAADTGAVAYSPPPLRAVRGYSFTYDALEAFYHAAIQHYKAELLNEVGEPVAYMTTDEEGSASMLFFDRAEALKYSGDDEPVNLFAESQLEAAQEELNQCSGLLDDSLRSIEMLEDQLATAEQRVAEVTALNPMLEILDPARRLFIIANLLELKYLPIYADQPDPTYITKWVWEVRDQFGASICEAHEWLYQAIDNAEKAISATGASS